MTPGLISYQAHAYDHGKIFVLDYDGLLSSFDAATGAPGWSTKMPRQYAFSAAPTVDQATGNPLWTFAGDGQLTSAPIVIDNVVIVASASGKVYALDADAGSLVWSAMAGGQISYNINAGGLAAGDG